MERQAKVARKSQNADLAEQVGQLLIIGFDGTEMSPSLEALIRRVQPGGVILFARNIVSAQQTHELLKACQKLSPTPLFCCVDMEGGLVDRLKKAVAPAPSPAAVFATGDRKLFRNHGRLIGAECRALGFNTDFAPVSDLAFESSRKVMASRAVSANPKETIVYVREFLRGLRDAGVFGCGKHFPGLGEGQLDSHHDLPLIEKPWKKLWAEDLYPYRTLRRDYPFVMVCHAAYPRITGVQTASLSSRWISQVLRKKIGYRGLIISDDLEMGGVLSAAPVEQAAIQHIRAGGDIALICHKEEFVLRSYERLLKETQADRRFAQHVSNSVQRVLAFKRKARPLKRFPPPPSEKTVERLSRQLWEFSEQVRLETLAEEERA